MAGFNKMYVMLPVMYFSRQLDGDDPDIVFKLRAAYAAVQLVCVCIVAYTYIQAMLIPEDMKNKIIYIPPPPTPFNIPGEDTKKKYTEKSFGEHVKSEALKLLGSTLFGIAMTAGLHIYKKMVVGIAMQAVMGPLNLIENALVKAILFGNNIRIEDKIFNEKFADELTDNDEVVDSSGNAMIRNTSLNEGKKPTSTAEVTGDSSDKTEKTIEDIMLDVWDAGASADILVLMKSLTTKNCNIQTKEDGWTPFMIVAGLANINGTADAIKKLVELGADPAITDKEGWNALHWAAFHGNFDAAKELMKNNEDCMKIKDKDGYTPSEIAKKEGNDAISKLFYIETPITSENPSLRKRK